MEIQKFNPKKAELIALAEKYKSLKIKDINDTLGYNAVKEALSEIIHSRTDITKQGKGFREEAIKWQKDIIVVEKELVGIISGTEDILKAEKQRIDDLNTMEERKATLPMRKKMLEEVEAICDDRNILLMDDKEFGGFYMEYKEIFDNKQREKELEAEREIERKQEIANAVKDAEERVKKETEAKVKELEDNRIRKEIEEKKEAEKMESSKKFTDNLKKAGFNKETDKMFRDGKVVTIYRKFAEFKI